MRLHATLLTCVIAAAPLAAHSADTVISGPGWTVSRDSTHAYSESTVSHSSGYPLPPGGAYVTDSKVDTSPYAAGPTTNVSNSENSLFFIPVTEGCTFCGGYVNYDVSGSSRGDSSWMGGSIELRGDMTVGDLVPVPGIYGGWSEVGWTENWSVSFDERWSQVDIFFGDTFQATSSILGGGSARFQAFTELVAAGTDGSGSSPIVDREWFGGGSESFVLSTTLTSSGSLRLENQLFAQLSLHVPGGSTARGTAWLDGIPGNLSFRFVPVDPLVTLPESGELLITPVPEPETYALLLAGLGLLGFAARRRAVFAAGQRA